MTFFVTGFDGYVGSHVVSALRQRGAAIAALVRDEGQAGRAEEAGLSPVRVALSDAPGLAAAVRTFQGVGHFAASERPDFQDVNEAAVRAMIGALPAGASFVMQGGTMVFGEQGRERPSIEPRFMPPPPLARRAALDAFVLRAAVDGTRTHVVYGAFVFGGAGAMIPNALVRAALAAGVSGYPDDGSAVWSGVHVADWADLMAAALIGDDPGGKPVFGAAQDVAVSDMAHHAGAVLSPARPARAVSIDQARQLWPFFADGLRLFQRFDAAPAALRFGWKPRPRDLAEAFRDARDAVSRQA